MIEIAHYSRGKHFVRIRNCAVPKGILAHDALDFHIAINTDAFTDGIHVMDSGKGFCSAGRSAQRRGKRSMFREKC